MHKAVRIIVSGGRKASNLPPSKTRLQQFAEIMLCWPRTTDMQEGNQGTRKEMNRPVPDGLLIDIVKDVIIQAG